MMCAFLPACMFFAANETFPENKLQDEKSPYLQKHADDPVDWYPWGPAAFAKAKAEDKPVFLSIGYSSCHWCHVMEDESFENPAIAKLINETFVPVKVDREERPDIDSLYMSVAQLIAGLSGWPLTIILTPEKKPFYAATYIPDETRFGTTGMVELIPVIKKVWEDQRGQVLESANRITNALSDIEKMYGVMSGKIDESVLSDAFEKLASIYDPEHGGFGTAPKFPSPNHLSLLLRIWKSTGNEKALLMVENTLKHMRMGGIYDHVGHGFHRYSTDRKRLVPHFEKMLYDQALLSIAYTEAFQASGSSEYRKTVEDTLNFVLREMTAPEGGFYTAQDADTGGVEGDYYKWTAREMKKTLRRRDRRIAEAVYNITEEGNFSDTASGMRTGENILHMTKTLTQLSQDLDIPEKKLSLRLEGIRAKLFEARTLRERPLTDDKILTDWNGLMIAAFAKAGAVFGEQPYIDAAARAAEFILDTMVSSEGTLLHRYRDGEAAVFGQLNDYAFLIWGFIELYEAGFDMRYLLAAFELNSTLLSRFWDHEESAFFLTPDDGETVLVRRKELFDGSVPSGNSIAVLNLLRLARISADAALEKHASGLLSSYAKLVQDSPTNFTQLLCSADFWLGHSYEIVVVGDRDAEDTKALLSRLNREFIPSKVVLLRDGAEQDGELDRIAPFTRDFSRIGGKATVYVCKNSACMLPTTRGDEMLELLDRRTTATE